MPATRGPRVSEESHRSSDTASVQLRCLNCSRPVWVSPETERAHCTYCSNVWNWKTKQLIRGQR